MEIRMVLINLLTVIAFSSVVQTFAPPEKTTKLQHQEDISQRFVEDSAGQQKQIMNFLSIFDEMQKRMKPRFVPTTSGLHDYARIFGKGVKKDNLDGHSYPYFSQHEDTTESNKEFLQKYPFSGKKFRKTAAQSPKKSKKRACFWKYCVQSK